MNRKYVVSETEVGRFAYFLSHLSLLHLVAAYVVTKLAGAALVAEQEMGVQEFCETELFNATCGPTEVILMTHAQYGRMRMGRCVKLDYGHMGCASDVIEQTDGRCSGRRQCEIRIPDALFAETLPCPDDLKPYLEASFRCVKVHTPKSDTCTNRDLIIKDSEGYLSNLVSQQTGCGTVHNPWLVRVQSGQTVRIRLLDFAVSKRREGLYPYTQCQIYGEIKERLTSGLRNITVCGANVRDHVVYTSVSNSVEISLKTGSGEDPAITPYYLFKYEAVGCPDRVLPVGSYGVRQGDGLVVRCNFTNDVFHLKCVGTVWVGELRNCSKSTTSRKVHISSGGEDLGIPYGLSILIVLAIALVIGLFVLFTGLAFLKKNRRHDGTSGAQLSDVYDKHYVRSPWIQTQTALDGSTTLASMTGSTKTSPWRETTRGPALVSELPPCTPLMDRGHRPPSYGQIQAHRRRLACGCYVDGNPAAGVDDLCDYPSRHEILATGCPGSCTAASCTPPAGGGGGGTRAVNPDHLILKSSDRAQYFVVDATPIYTVRNDVNNPRLQGAPQAGRPKATSGEHMQTDDLKLKLKVTDKPPPSCAYSGSCAADDCERSDQCPESRPLIQNESPDSATNCSSSCNANNETAT